jgi:hypothetical protein
MATNIYNYDGTLLTTIPDGSIDTTSASIKFPGRGYVNYGEPVNENLLWLLQNFASGSPPATPTNGQIWYDTSTKLVKVYDSTSMSWASVGGVIRSSTPPISGANVGAFWYDTSKNQLHTWSGTAWLLLGPLGASDNLDPLNPVNPTYSRIDAARISDGSANHQVWRITIGNVVFAIISKDASFVPNPAIPGFAQINPGINFNTNIADVGISGDSTLFKSTQNNIPSVNNIYDMGSSSRRFANMYATLFDGTATSARYADLAERYEADRPYSPGTVVCLGGEKEITASTTPGNDDVFGIISTNPAHLMNSGAGNDDTHPAVALVGRVPCKIVGQVKKGQRVMASSMEGVACAWDPAFGNLAIIGRAIDAKTTHGVELIEIVVGKN